MYVIITKPNNILIWLTHVFPHLAPVTYFPMLGISYINLLWVQIVTIHVLFISTLIAPSLELNKLYNFQDCITKTFVQEKKWLSPMHFCHLHPPLPSKMFLYYVVTCSLVFIRYRFLHTHQYFLHCDKCHSPRHQAAVSPRPYTCHYTIPAKW